MYRLCSSLSESRNGRLCQPLEHTQFECVHRLFLDEIIRLSNAGTPFSYAVQGEDNELHLFNYKDFDLRIGGKKK